MVQGDEEWVAYVYVAWLRPVRDGGVAVGCGRGAGWRRRASPPLCVWAAGGTCGTVLVGR